MSLEVFPGTAPLARPAPSIWGEITPMGETALVVRFALVGCWVSFPAVHLQRWEHRVGEPELLTIKAETTRSSSKTAICSKSVRRSLSTGEASPLLTRISRVTDPNAALDWRQTPPEMLAISG